MVSLTTGIFCRTYAKDAERLYFTLRSIGKFCLDFDEVVIATPPSSFNTISRIVGEFEFAKCIECPGTVVDFIGQQISKMTANDFMKSDIIVHIDSDCVFTRTVRPSDLTRNGKPVLYYCPYSYFYENGINMPWQTVTSGFLRRQVDFEFMRLFPLIYPRRLYDDLQNWYRNTYSEEINKIEHRIHGDYFSEFNLMGSFSYYSGNDYHEYINILEHSPEEFVRQFCLVGSRDDRSVSASDRNLIEHLLSDPSSPDVGPAATYEETEMVNETSDVLQDDTGTAVAPSSEQPFAHRSGPIDEMEAFRKAALWDGGFADADPLLPLSWSSYSTTGFVSIYYATYLACVKPYIRHGDVAMEIGPGRGVWTRALIRRGAGRVYTLDVLPRELNVIDEILGSDVDRLEYIVVKNFTGDGVPDGEIDFFWSFGTFVHLSKNAQAAYIQTIKRKLKPGGRGFIQFADVDTWNRVVTDKALHVHELLADRLNIGEAETVRRLMSESPVIPAREQLPPSIQDDHTIHPGRYFFVGTEWIARELEAAGLTVVDANVIENLRDPVIHFRNPE